MGFIKVAVKNDVPTNKMIMVTVEGKEVLLANVNNSYFAIANKCTHLGGALSKGSLDGTLVTCPRHGAQFDVTTGQAVGEAKIAFMKMKVKDEPAYEIKVEGEDVLIKTS